MRKALISCIGGFAFAIAAIGSAQAAIITPAVEYTTFSATFNDDRDFTLGYMFSLSAPVTINALGYWDNGLSNNHQVGIWGSSNVLVTSTTVLSTDPLVGHFRWSTIPDLVLNAGQYTIGGEFLGNFNVSPDVLPSQASGVTTIPNYTYVTGAYVVGAGLNQPTTITDGFGPNGILLANFSVASNVPEPSTLGLIGLGLLGLGAMRRRRHRGAQEVEQYGAQWCRSCRAKSTW
jgi:hypothetical protein